MARQRAAAPEPRVGLAQAFTGIGDGWAATAWMSDACRVAPRREDLWQELLRMLHTRHGFPERHP